MPSVSEPAWPRRIGKGRTCDNLEAQGMTRIDPLEQLPVGSALLVREQIDPPALWEMVWLVREETARIGRLGQNPAMEFRAGLFLEEVGRVLVAVVPVLVRVGPEQ